ncbi:unnamed protein product, partial [Musa hybrid cultivar]
DASNNSPFVTTACRLLKPNVEALLGRSFLSCRYTISITHCIKLIITPLLFSV